MEKVSIQSQTMKTIVGIGVVEFLQYFQFTEASFVPGNESRKNDIKNLVHTTLVHFNRKHLHDLMVSYDFDGCVSISACLISCTYHITEYPLTGETWHDVSIVQHFANANSVVTLCIIPVICQRWIVVDVFTGNRSAWTLWKWVNLIFTLKPNRRHRKHLHRNWNSCPVRRTYPTLIA